MNCVSLIVSRNAYRIITGSFEDLSNGALHRVMLDVSFLRHTTVEFNVECCVLPFVLVVVFSSIQGCGTRFDRLNDNRGHILWIH
jgi:hypothetical protein